MKTIQLNKVKYECPTSYEEVTLRMRMKVEDDAEKIIDNPTLKRIAYISGYCNIPIEVLKETPMDKIGKIFKHLQFLSEELPTKAITTFEYKGEKYYVMPTLEKGQFQDFVSLDTATSAHKDDAHNALPLVLAILCKKEGETLDDYDVEERAKHLMDLPMTIVEPLRVFFWTIGKSSQLSIQLSSMEGKELLLNAKANVLHDTLNKQVGGGLLMRLQRGMLRRWIQYLQNHWTKFFNSIRSKSSKEN